MTTGQLAETLDSAFGLRIDPAALEALLLEFDRRAYLEWITVTTAGEYVWDLTDSADRIADAIAAVVADVVCSWLEDR